MSDIQSRWHHQNAPRSAPAAVDRIWSRSPFAWVSRAMVSNTVAAVAPDIEPAAGVPGAHVTHVASRPSAPAGQELKVSAEGLESNSTEVLTHHGIALADAKQTQAQPGLGTSVSSDESSGWSSLTMDITSLEAPSRATEFIGNNAPQGSHSATEPNSAAGNDSTFAKASHPVSEVFTRSTDAARPDPIVITERQVSHNTKTSWDESGPPSRTAKVRTHDQPGSHSTTDASPQLPLGSDEHNATPAVRSGHDMGTAAHNGAPHAARVMQRPIAIRSARERSVLHRKGIGSAQENTPTAAIPLAATLFRQHATPLVSTDAPASHAIGLNVSDRRVLPEAAQEVASHRSAGLGQQDPFPRVLDRVVTGPLVADSPAQHAHEASPEYQSSVPIERIQERHQPEQSQPPALLKAQSDGRRTIQGLSERITTPSPMTLRKQAELSASDAPADASLPPATRERHDGVRTTSGNEQLEAASAPTQASLGSVQKDAVPAPSATISGTDTHTSSAANLATVEAPGFLSSVATLVYLQRGTDHGTSTARPHDVRDTSTDAVDVLPHSSITVQPSQDDRNATSALTSVSRLEPVFSPNLTLKDQSRLAEAPASPSASLQRTSGRPHSLLEATQASHLLGEHIHRAIPSVPTSKAAHRPFQEHGTSRSIPSARSAAPYQEPLEVVAPSGVIDRTAASSVNTSAEMIPPDRPAPAVPVLVQPSPLPAEASVKPVHRTSAAYAEAVPARPPAYTSLTHINRAYRAVQTGSAPASWDRAEPSSATVSVAHAPVPTYLQRSVAPPPPPVQATVSASASQRLTPPASASKQPPATEANIASLANRVYDLLVRRLHSERQRRGA